MPDTDKVRLEVKETSRNSVISMKKARMAPTRTVPVVLSKTSKSWKRNTLTVVAIVIPRMRNGK